MNTNHRNHRQSWLGRLAALLAVAMLASMLPVSALAELPGAWSSGDDIRENSALESEDEIGSGVLSLYGSEEEPEEEETHTPVITGFELSATEYEFSYKPDLDVLRSNLPGSICMYVDGSSVYVDVFWECDDYAEANNGDFIFEAEFDTSTVHIGDRSWDIDDLIFADGVRMPRIRVTVNAVTGFEPLGRTVYATSRKPDSIEDAVSSMRLPDVVYGYVDGSSERTAFAVNWFCENFGAEFSDEFIFNASFKGEQYALKDGVEMPSVTLKLIESDEFSVGDIDEENMTLTITGWKYDDTFLLVPREIEGYTVTAIDDHAFDGCRMLTAVELPDSIESYGKNVFGSNPAITEVRLSVGCESTTLFTREDGRTAYIHEVEDIPVELPLPVTDIEVLPGGSLFLDGDFTLLEDHEIIVRPDDPETWEDDPGFMVVGEGRTLVNHGIILVEEKASFVNFGTVRSCDIFSLVEGKIEGNRLITEHEFDEDGKCLYCDAAIVSVEIAIDEKPTKVYDGADECPLEDLVFHIEGAQEDSTLIAEPIEAHFDAVEAGDHTLTITFQIADALDPLSAPATQQVVCEGAILPKTITVLPDEGQGKVYGEPEPEYGYTVDGLVGEDACSGALSRVSGEDAGYYDFELGDLSAGDNYTIELLPALFEIVARPISSEDIHMALLDDQYYTGEPLEPEVWMLMGDSLLEQGVDFTVDYYDNVEVGTGSAVVNGIGNYFGTREAQTFRILENPVNEQPAALDVSGSVDEGDALGQGSLTLNDVPQEEEEVLLPGEYETFEAEARDESPESPATTATTSADGKYEYVPDATANTIKITKYNGEETEITVPGEIDGKTVTTIGTGVFANMPEITSVTLPKSVTALEASVFFNSLLLSTVVIHDAVNKVGDNQFGEQNAVVTRKLIVDAKDTQIIAADTYNHGSEATNLKFPLNFTDVEVSADAALALNTDFNIPAGHTFIVREGGTANIATGKAFTNQGETEIAGTVQNNGTIYSCKAGSTVTVTGTLSGNTDIVKDHEFDATTGKCRHCVAKKLFVNLKNPDAITKVYDGTVNASFSPDAYEITNLEAGEAVAIGTASGVYDNPEVGSGHSVTVSLATDIVSMDYIIDQRTETGSITARPIAEVTAQAIPDQKHTGKQVKPVVVLSYGDLLLVEGVDYVVDYSNNVDIGQATAIVTGTGNFNGQMSLPFNIIDTTKRTREIRAQLIGNAPTKEYDGKLNVMGLSAADFEIVPNKVEPGDTVTITGITASYTSIHTGRQKVVVRFSIEQQSASYFYTVEDLTIEGTITKKNLVIIPAANQQKEYSDVYNVAYTADGLLSIDKLEGTLSVDSEKVGVRNITVGTLHAVNRATGKTSDDYNIIVQPQTLTITAIPINSPKLKITPIGDQKYTGFEIKPTVTITNINNNYVLKEGTDYTLGNYKNNKEVGTATVTVTGKENCTGTIDLTFTIVKKPISDRDITCSEIATQTISGSNSKVEPTFTLTHKSTGGTRTLVKGTDYEATYSNNTKAGTGTITITAKSDSNYTGTRKETFKIKGSSSSSSSSTYSTDYVYYRAINGKQALIVEVDDKDAYYVFDLQNRRFLIGDFTGTLKEGMEIHFPGVSLVANVVPLTDKKTYPDEILLSIPGHRVRMCRVVKTADKTDLEYFTDAENGTEFDYELFEAIMEALSDDGIGELWLDQENLGVVLYDENYQPLPFSQSEDALVPVVGGDNATAQKRLRIAPKPLKDANGQTVYADSSQALAKYPTAHLRLTMEQISKLIKNGYTEIAYEVGGAEVRLPLGLLAPEVTVAGNGVTASVKQSVDAYDICLEPYDGHATEKEAAALKGYTVVNPAARVAISAAIGKYPESVTAELAKSDDAENGTASAALASAQGRAPDHPDVTFVAERLNYVTDIGAAAPVGVAPKRAQSAVEDTAGDEITFIEDEEEAPAEAPEAEASAVEQPDGLTGQVYFLLKLLDTESVYKLPEEVIAEGTRNGGVIEIYENVKFADTRDKALSANDGTIFSESHRRFGSCVIRLSARLNATERQAVENSILTALSSETPMAVKSAFSQELPRFIPMLPAWNGSVRMLLNMDAETTPKNALALSAPTAGDASVADMAKVSEGGSNYVEFYPAESGLYAVVEPPVQPTVQKPVPVVAPVEPEQTEVENAPAAPEKTGDSTDVGFEEVPAETAEPEPTETPAATPEPVRDPEPLYAYTRRANGANMYWLVNTQNMNVEFYREDTKTYLSGSYTGSLVNGMNIQYSDGSEGNIRLKFQQTYKFASTTVDGEELLIEQGNAADVEEVLRKVRK